MSRPTSLSQSELRAIVRVLEQARSDERIGLSASEWAAVARAEVKLRARLHQQEAAPAASRDAQEPRP